MNAHFLKEILILADYQISLNQLQLFIVLIVVITITPPTASFDL